jgi:VWFA-related protein
MSFRRSLFSLLALLSIPLLFSQTGESPESANPTFKAKVQVVLVDVVVADRNGQPIKGLQKDDFEVFENGKRQTIASFEEHRGEPTAPVAPRPPLPPHFYSNAPVAPPPGAINVLLLDGLNTEFSDQAAVRRQMIDYLKRINPGPQLGIFTLGSQLRMVEGFTTDPKALIEAINHKHWGGKPETSPMLRTSAEDNVDQAILNSMSGGHASSDGIAALARFQAEMASTEAVNRMSATLDALKELSRYLSGFKGRKNIIWFSDSFPQIDFPSGGERTRIDISSDNGLEKEMKETINMLAAAQIAVYPIAAQGLDTQAMYQAQNMAGPMGIGMTPGERAITDQNQSLQQENVNRYFNHKAADDIASNTGGQAFYNTNGLKDALAEVVHKGAYYYRLSYSPSDKKMVGRYRHIKVKIKKGPYATPYNVAYRRGYYEENEKQASKAKLGPVADLLHPLMGRGLPDATEILYNLRLIPSTVQPGAEGALVGDNKDLRRPVTRYSADFVIPVDSLEFEVTSDGVRHGNVELALVVYDHGGRPLNWIVRSIRTTLKPEIYPAVQKTGVQFHQEMDVPKGEDLYVRAGIYDLEADKAGTLEIPLSEITNGEELETRVPRASANAVRSQPTSTATTPMSDRSSTGASAANNSSSDQTIASASTPGAGGPVPHPTNSGFGAGAPQELRTLQDSDIPAYCAGLAGGGEHSSSLAKVCEFALAMRKKLPDVICDRQTKRYWTVARRYSARGSFATDEEHHADVVTAQVRYRNGDEYYSDVRVDGKPIAAAAPEVSGTWSDGEFATILAGVFVPSSKAEFHYEKEEKLNSIPTLVFDFHVKAENNKLYLLTSGGMTWFPDYSGKLWVDERTSSLLRLERETAYMLQYPIRRMRTEIDYSNVPLGDGTSLVLPTHSNVLICTPPVHINGDSCGRNIIRFTDWHKFGATTKIVMRPAN